MLLTAFVEVRVGIYYAHLAVVHHQLLSIHSGVPTLLVALVSTLFVIILLSPGRIVSVVVLLIMVIPVMVLGSIGLRGSFLLVIGF